MSMSDPIADMLTRIRNALVANHERVEIPTSRMKEEICSVLKGEGFISDYRIAGEGNLGVLQVTLKYEDRKKPVIQGLKRVSRPSLRVYVKSKEIRLVRNGLGVAILSTPRGVMTSKQARASNLGGEVLCEVW